MQSSKAGETSYTSYDDVNYSTGEEKSPFFWLLPMMQWSAILSVSANSMEVATLGAVDPEQSAWVQWTQEDNGRAELPLDSGNR